MPVLAATRVSLKTGCRAREPTQTDCVPRLCKLQAGQPTAQEGGPEAARGWERGVRIGSVC